VAAVGGIRAALVAIVALGDAVVRDDDVLRRRRLVGDGLEEAIGLRLDVAGSVAGITRSITGTPSCSETADSKARRKAVPVVLEVRCGNSGTTTIFSTPSTFRRAFSDAMLGSP